VYRSVRCSIVTSFCCRLTNYIFICILRYCLGTELEVYYLAIAKSEISPRSCNIITIALFHCVTV
jgi:hypothetical protein